MKEESVILIDPETMSGVPVFRGTRVPIYALFDYLSEDGSIENFLEDYDHITRAMVIDVFDTLSKQYSEPALTLEYESFA